MASLRQAPGILRRVGPFRFAKHVWAEVTQDNVFTLASALAYSWLFAIFPFLIFLLSLIPLVMKPEWKDRAIKTVRENVDRLPKEAASAIDQVVTAFLQGDQGKQVGLLSIGLFLTLWAASSGMAMTMSALDTAFDAPKQRPFYIQRPLALVLTILVASMVVAVLILLPVGSFAVDLINKYGVNWAAKIGLDAKWIAPITWTWNAVRFSLAFVLMFGVLGVVYQWGANRKRKFRIFTPGTVFCVAVWIVLAIAFRLYVDRFGKYDKTYGSVGGVAILLLFFYIDALVLLIGAEVDAEFDAELAKQST